MIHSVLDNQKSSKNTFHATKFNLKKIQVLFKDLHRNVRTFQGKMEFKDFSRTSPKIQGLFKTLRTLVTVTSTVIKALCRTRKQGYGRGEIRTALLLGW